MLVNFDSLKTIMSGFKTYVDDLVRSRTENLDINVEQVNADWNENDTEAKSYIKNRPFYTGDLEEIEIIPQMTVTIEPNPYEPDAPTAWGWACEGSLLVPGQVYEVTWEGVVYNCDAVLLDGVPFIGNPYIWWPDNYDDNGMPFCIYSDGEWIACGILATTETVSRTVSCKTKSAAIHKIDKKYLPNDMLTIKTIPSEEYPINSTEEFLVLPNGYYHISIDYAMPVLIDAEIDEDGNVLSSEEIEIYGLIYKDYSEIVSYDTGYIYFLDIINGDLYAYESYAIDGFGWKDSEIILGNDAWNHEFHTKEQTVIGAIDELADRYPEGTFDISYGDTYVAAEYFQELVRDKWERSRVLSLDDGVHHTLSSFAVTVSDIDAEGNRIFEGCLDFYAIYPTFVESDEIEDTWPHIKQEYMNGCEISIYRVHSDGSIDHLEYTLGEGNSTSSGLPEVTEADNGKVLQVVNGQWVLVDPSSINAAEVNELADLVGGDA